jgi:cytochrome c oxidase subunit IV
MEEENKEPQEHEEPGYGTYIYVWLILLVFTALTITSAGVKVGRLNVFTVLLIASLKSSLVLGYFMHLLYEKRIFKIMFFVTIATLTIFIALTFVDISFRR